MNCLECQEIIQGCLDGELVPTDGGEFATHLALCADCRDHYAAAECLLDGLRVLCIGAVPGRPYEPPAWTTEAADGD